MAVWARKILLKWSQRQWDNKTTWTYHIWTVQVTASGQEPEKTISNMSKTRVNASWGLQTQKTDKSTKLALSRCYEPMMKHAAVTFFLWYCIVSMSYVNQYNISFKCKCLTSDGWNLVVFIWRFLRYQDSSTWPKWSSFIGFCCMNN